ncbi:protease-4 [Lewinella marina]|uniref:Signal peptide peptidase SppA n=1 Tax=Neolewinella marina TaxID=438751 RepID=A0A2G0CDF3_9BACT|nr:signal peptide peptidase SppA [Neolewinella marina]NJB86026.1 protease-4 [Neolewinella marina]PHK98008.1 signal peptide peptidase SppA [Neolewinella marina]
MPNFLKLLLGSCLGTLLALVALVLVGSAVVGSLAANSQDKPTVEQNSILTIELDGLPELTGNVAESDIFASLNGEEKLGLHDIIRAIEHAAEDDDIKGIYLGKEPSGVPFTTLRTLREAIRDFKDSGKFVVAYSPYYTQSAYYLGSVADEVYLGPLGVVDFRGLGADIPFFKNALDQAGIKFEIFYAGDYKSATEPLRRTEISPENREQTKEFLNDLFSVMLADISDSRQVSTASLHAAAGNMTGWKGEEAVTAGLIDGIRHRTEIDELLHDKVGFEYDEKLNLIDLSDYYSARLERLDGGDDEVAILVAEGGIVDGDGDLGSIGDRKYVNEIEKLAEDDDVRAVVLRVNSGGGSASSSENIWYAVEKLKAAGKPVVVSMGDYAASGGYYISAAADSVFAEPTTITGSIGVFLTFPVIRELMEDKIGISFDTVNTAANANAFSPFREMGEDERRLLNQRTQAIYQTFLNRVAEGRNIPEERVREIAGGRVYSGTRALEIGLVDRLGGLEEAIASAANLAGMEDDYSIAHYPKMKPYWETLIEELMGESDDNRVVSKVLKDRLGANSYRHFELIRDLTQLREPQARLPLVVTF